MEFHDTAPTEEEIRKAATGAIFICINIESTLYHAPPCAYTIYEWGRTYVKGFHSHNGDDPVEGGSRRSTLSLNRIRLQKTIKLGRSERLQNVQEEKEGLKEALEDLDAQEVDLLAFPTDEAERNHKLIKRCGEEDAKQLITTAKLLDVEDRLDALLAKKEVGEEVE